MKHVTVRRLKDGTKKYTFKAPKDIRDAGLLKNQIFTDGRTLRYEHPKLLKIIEGFRKGGLAAVALTRDNNLNQAITHFLKTEHYNKVVSDGAERSIASAYKFIKNEMGTLAIKNIDAKDLNERYQRWVKKDTANLAARRLKALEHLFGYLVINGLMDFDFTKAVVKTTITKKPVSYSWTKELLTEVIGECFQTFKTSSIGLHLLITYETAQRPADVSALVWEDVDFDGGSVRFSTRGLTMPLQDSTIRLLKQQLEMWKFQKYVLPIHRQSDNSFIPLSASHIRTYLVRIFDKLGKEGVQTVAGIRDLSAWEMAGLGLGPAELANILGVDPRSVGRYYPIERIKTKELLLRRFGNLQEG